MFCSKARGKKSLLRTGRGHQQAIVIADDVVQHELAALDLATDRVEETLLALDRVGNDLLDVLDDAVRGRVEPAPDRNGRGGSIELISWSEPLAR